MSLSAPPVAICWSPTQVMAKGAELLISGLRLVCASKLPSDTVHIPSAWSAVTEQRRALLGENFTLLTASSPVITLFSVPLAASHSLMLPSAPPVASHLPSALAAMVWEKVELRLPIAVSGGTEPTPLSLGNCLFTMGHGFCTFLGRRQSLISR